MSKYDPLGERLRLTKVPVWHATFDEIERILGFRLPPSARRHQAWWANEERPITHVHKNVWLNAGWRVEDLDLPGRSVLFRRAGAAAPDTPVPADAPAPPTKPVAPGVRTDHVPAWETPEVVACGIRLEWQPAGSVTLDGVGKLTFPSVLAVPGLYRFRVRRAGKDVIYVGESENLARRFAHYRNSGPTQATNVRLADALHKALAFGESVSVSLVTDTAWLDRGQGDERADLSAKAVRRLFEQAAIASGGHSHVELLNR